MAVIVFEAEGCPGVYLRDNSSVSDLSPLREQTGSKAAVLLPLVPLLSLSLSAAQHQNVAVSQPPRGAVCMFT